MNHFQKNKFYFTFIDISNSLSIFKIINKIKPDEIYNLARNHMWLFIKLPEYTTNVDAMGTLRILDAIVQSKKK